MRFGLPTSQTLFFGAKYPLQGYAEDVKRTTEVIGAKNKQLGVPTEVVDVWVNKEPETVRPTKGVVVLTEQADVDEFFRATEPLKAYPKAQQEQIRKQVVRQARIAYLAKQAEEMGIQDAADLLLAKASTQDPTGKVYPGSLSQYFQTLPYPDDRSARADIGLIGRIWTNRFDPVSGVEKN